MKKRKILSKSLAILTLAGLPFLMAISGCVALAEPDQYANDAQARTLANARGSVYVPPGTTNVTHEISYVDASWDKTVGIAARVKFMFDTDSEAARHFEASQSFYKSNNWTVVANHATPRHHRKLFGKDVTIPGEFRSEMKHSSRMVIYYTVREREQGSHVEILWYSHGPEWFRVSL